MVFSSILFLYIFLPVFLLVYHLVGKAYRNYVVLASSLIFYAWGAPKFVFLLITSLTLNFYIVQKLYSSTSNRKILLILSLLINVGLLAYFKYANFFVENVNYLLSQLGIEAVSWTKIILPIGISFFTFQSLTYTIDVYRNVHAPLKKLSDYLLYILMFPQLIAGPIVRFNTIADEIVDRNKYETLDYKLTGFYRFVIGLSKKVLIANILGEQVDIIFAKPIAELDAGLAWVGIVAYSFQIYFDFCGYSDLAIGLGKMIGFNFPENFNNPYVSKNISEFWRRWHITLGTWMRDYLYIPLGGNRVNSKTRLYANLIIVFLLSGLWHGASWNFVIWGAWHGLFLMLDRLFLEKLLKRLGSFFSVIFTYVIVVIGWVFFRVETFDDSIAYIGKMFSFEFNLSTSAFKPEFWTILIIAAIFSFITLSKTGKKLETSFYYTNYKIRGHIIAFIISIIFLLISSGYIASFGFNPFIYFRF